MHSSSSSPLFTGHMNIILPRNWGILNVHFDQHLLSAYCMKSILFGMEGYGDKDHLAFRNMFTKLSNYKQVKHIQLIRKDINLRLTLELKSLKFENQTVIIQVPQSKEILNTYENVYIYIHIYVNIIYINYMEIFLFSFL